MRACNRFARNARDIAGWRVGGEAIGLREAYFFAIGEETHLFLDGIRHLATPSGDFNGLSALVVFLSLVFWGWVLGPVGMILSVPLTMTLKLALENNPDTRAIAIMLVFHLILTRTSFGFALRATAENPQLAQVAGVHLNSMINKVWWIGGIMAALDKTYPTMDCSI